jgi:hypothetical protein
MKRVFQLIAFLKDIGGVGETRSNVAFAKKT